VLWPLVGIALTVAQDQHGPPLLVGFAAGALLLWRDRRRQLSDTVEESTWHESRSSATD
jgi:hypothetical protein